MKGAPMENAGVNDSPYDEIMRGNRRFMEKNRDFTNLTEGQNPHTVVISCSDSRVAPSITMDQPLGSIFEIRTAGEVVDEAALASVEFAVNDLGTSNILVVGHTRCGAVTAARKLFSRASGASANCGSALERAVEGIYRIISEKDENRESLTSAVKCNARAQLNRLMESSLIKGRQAAGELHMQAALYDIDSGMLELI